MRKGLKIYDASYAPAELRGTVLYTDERLWGDGPRRARTCVLSSLGPSRACS